jgi:hypothetical protein
MKSSDNGLKEKACADLADQFLDREKITGGLLEYLHIAETPFFAIRYNVPTMAQFSTTYSVHRAVCGAGNR